MEKKKKTKGIKFDLIDGEQERKAGFNISWGSIIAGIVTFLALLVTFSLIGSAIGFGTVSPTENHPFDGVGTGLLIWTIVAFVLSLFAGGFVAGITSRRMGIVHGFLTWATSVLVLLVALTFVTTGIFSVIGSTVGSVVSVAGDGVQSVASGTGDLISKGFDELVGKVGEVDTEELEEQTEQILKDTDVPELQPNYINNQMKEASDEIMNAGKEIALDPDNAEQIIDQTVASLKEKADTIVDAADKDAIANAVNKNTDLNQEEAEKATENIYNGLQTASENAQEMLNEASVKVEQAKQEIDKKIQQARVKADEIADTTAKASIWGFVALLLGLILTSFAGLLGSNYVAGRNEERM